MAASNPPFFYYRGVQVYREKRDSHAQDSVLQYHYSLSSEVQYATFDIRDLPVPDDMPDVDDTRDRHKAIIKHAIDVGILDNFPTLLVPTSSDEDPTEVVEFDTDGGSVRITLWNDGQVGLGGTAFVSYTEQGYQPGDSLWADYKEALSTMLLALVGAGVTNKDTLKEAVDTSLENLVRYLEA